MSAEVPPSTVADVPPEALEAGRSEAPAAGRAEEQPAPEPKTVALSSWIPIGKLSMAFRVLLGVALIGAIIAGTCLMGRVELQGIHMPDILIVVHGTSEAESLRAPATRLVDAGRSVLLLPLGDAADHRALCRAGAGAGAGAGAEEAAAPCEPVAPVATLKELGVTDFSATSDQPLSDRMLNRITDSIKAKLVITGMHHPWQLQLGAALRNASRSSGARFAAYYGGLRSLALGDKAALQRRFADEADEVWVAAGVLWPEGWPHKYIAVGHEMFQQDGSSADAAQVRKIRRDLYGDRAVDEGSFTACWFGGCGPGHREALKAWTQVVWQMRQMPHWNFAVYSDPTCSEDDKEVLRQANLQNIVAPPALKRELVALASNFSASQGCADSSLPPAAFLTRGAAILDPAGSCKENRDLGALLGFMPQARSKEELEKVAQDFMGNSEKARTETATKLAGAGVPTDAAAAMEEAATRLWNDAIR